MNYNLTLTANQMHELHKAVELLMRLKIGQYQELIYDLCDIHSVEKQETIDAADNLLKEAFILINTGKKSNEYKDQEWFILYDMYQVLRKAIHDAETPDRPGLDAVEPMQMSKEPLIEWRTT